MRLMPTEASCPPPAHLSHRPRRFFASVLLPLLIAAGLWAPAFARPAIPQPGETLHAPLPARRLAADPQAPTPTIAWNQAPEHLGQHVTVEGRIVWAHNHRDQIWFLNFTEGRDGPFYLAVFRSAFWHLGPEADPTARYRGRTLQVTGQVTRHRGRPCMNIRSLDQIVVMPHDR